MVLTGARATERPDAGPAEDFFDNFLNGAGK
jgi:hypothetical protein